MFMCRFPDESFVVLRTELPATMPHPVIGAING